MKVYNFRVEVEEAYQGASSLMSEIINEVKDEQSQLKISEKINEKTTEIHREILTSYVDEINKHLNGIGLVGFVMRDKYFKEINSYKTHQSAMCKISHGENGYSSHELLISGISDKGFKDSKYTTYTGDFKITLNNHDVNTLWDIINSMKDSIKRYLKEQ